jgi:hypothetical protein
MSEDHIPADLDALIEYCRPLAERYAREVLEDRRRYWHRQGIIDALASHPDNR